MFNKRAGSVNMLAYIVWSSLFAMPCLLVLSLIVEGWPVMYASISHAKLTTWIAILWQTIGNSMFGYAVWGWLLSRYPAATVTPMALLIPVFGMATSSLMMAEPMPLWKITAALLIMSGLALNVLGPKLSRSTITALKTPGD
jgi:O-acetylserine/cysteine efflux transporter